MNTITHQKAAWIAAVITFVIGDTVTTVVGITHFGAVEANPVPRMMLGLGFEALVLLKVSVLILIYLWMRTLVGKEEYERYAIFVPLAPAALGLFATLYNLHIILSSI